MARMEAGSFDRAARLDEPHWAPGATLTQHDRLNIEWSKESRVGTEPAISSRVESQFLFGSALYA
jgi:hypothetical protein